MDISPSLHDINKFLENELMFFFFHNYRSTSNETDLVLIERLGIVLAIIKKDLSSHSSSICSHYAYTHLVRFYRLIGHTRSVFYGKGDHHLSYLMLFVWYKYFPTLAIYALHRFVVCTDGQQLALGSWRDIKYLCQFIRTYSENGAEHSLIDICCQFVNSQLDNDLQIRHIYALPRHDRGISNVSKWIPREYKQFDWLYNKLVIHWIRKNKPFILDHATDISYMSAISKSKRLYRKKIAGLNKALDTTQIKQCARNRKDIVPQHVSIYTQMKQPNLVLGYGLNDTEDRMSCSQHFKEWLDVKFSNDAIDTHVNCISSTPLPIYHYVKRAVQLIDLSAHSQPDEILYQRNLLDKEWSRLSKSFFSRLGGNAIPMIDVSDILCNINNECYYSSIGYSILFAQYGTILNRVLLVGNTPAWINLDNISGFVSVVEHIHQAVSFVYCTNANFKLAFQLIATTIRDAELEYRDIRNLRLVIFSTFSHLSNQDLFYDQIFSIFSENSVQTPFTMFWNVSKHFGEVLPCSIHQPYTGMVSGFSPFIFNTMRQHFNRYYNTPFHIMCNVLNNSHFDVLEDYITQIVT